jgi:hypothetical protein
MLGSSIGQEGKMERQYVRLRAYVHATFRADSLAAAALEKRTGESITTLAGGFAPRPDLNLTFHGGSTIAALSYFNFFVGGNAAWADGDLTSIDAALANAMQDGDLNNVLQQYFPGVEVTSSPLGSRVLPGSPPQAWSKGDAETVVQQLANDGTLAGVADAVDFRGTVFNFMLPHGALLFSDLTPSGNDPLGNGAQDDSKLRAAAAHGRRIDRGELRDEEDSLHGLAGYHGSVPLPDGSFAYYAVGVYSQFLTSTRTNGIPAFDQPWKDVVATFYHELCESRTNPDVEEVNRSGIDSMLGWYCDKHGEIGDLPMELAGAQWTLVMKEVPLANGQGTVPIQLMWSNAVDGPEGPIPDPH